MKIHKFHSSLRSSSHWKYCAYAICAHWNEVLTGASVPCAPINSIAQLLNHPHTKASGIIVDYAHPTAGELKGVGHPVLINGTARQAGLPPPVLGQHTDDVLGEMGLSSE